MGDEADFLLEQIDWDIDTFTMSVPVVLRRPMCKYCRKKKLLWRQVKGKWILFENRRKPHICKMHPLSIERLKSLVDLVKKENASERSSGTKR